MYLIKTQEIKGVNIMKASSSKRHKIVRLLSRLIKRNEKLQCKVWAYYKQLNANELLNLNKIQMI